MYVLMNIHGSPISKTAATDSPDLLERFWFWRGASGQNYIHSVYAPDHCPPLPGAVYVGVKRTSGMRIAMSVGRFSSFYGEMPDFGDCNEVHVHLLARKPGAAEDVCRDLLAAMDVDLMPQGFCEDAYGQSLAA